MYRQIIIPTDKEHNIELPESLYGKQVEITVKEIVAKPARPAIAKELRIRLENKAFWEDIPYNPGFPSVEDIRHPFDKLRGAWPKRN